MTGTMSRFRTYAPGTLAAAVWLGIAVAQTVSAQNATGQGDKVNAVISEQVKTAQAAQKRVAALDEEATGMLAEYRQATAETTGLKAYNDQLATQVKSQQDEL